ncbi:MAG: hypothetical protein WBX16_06800 [Candidatus Acidiferrales bacterium]
MDAPKQEKKKFLSVEVDPDHYERLSEIAKDQDRSAGSVVRLILKKFFALEPDEQLYALTFGLKRTEEKKKS